MHGRAEGHRSLLLFEMSAFEVLKKATLCRERDRDGDRKRRRDDEDRDRSRKDRREGDGMSIEETNAMRAKLGLKPLN